MVLLLAVLTIATLSQDFLMAERVHCIEDKFFVWTKPLNTFLTDNIPLKHAFMIICGLLMDIMVLVSFYRFALKGSTWRFPLSLLMFYVFRGIMQVRLDSIFNHLFSNFSL